MPPIYPLEKLVDSVCRYHPWYRSLLVQHPLQIQLQEAQLSELPLITAEVLDQHYFTSAARPDPELSVYKTSGTSSGIRKAIYYSKEDDEGYIAAKMASYREWLKNPSIVHKALADMGTGHAASTALAIFSRLGWQAASLSFELPIEAHIAKLKQFQPDLLYTMPSILDAIVAEAGNPLLFGIQKIILVGEIAPIEWQAHIAARFGIEPADILDTYGSIEIGAIASYSHELGLYIIDETLCAEALPAEQINDRFEPLQGNEAVLVLTSYIRSMFPAIRYVTYDVVRDFQTITINGNPRQAFQCISKRIGPDLKHGEKISLYDIESVVHQFVHDAELRVKLVHNQLSIHIRSRSLKEEMLIHIQHAIEHKISEIGQMIQNRILAGITVTRAAENEHLERGTVKSKKLYF
ncbi:phenylacetate-coenzyme A ligase PaaK-like adenylate-forming protein [Paenibacillus endophyticus]|uniref:Phenylacetate-coenzyme A ligase PaaK-like adenylate-forming protein n=1 Tax=Paenibacillus endophyticus TaxID=1294268 RepID=A0A7W5GBC7_9BACL|nr:hypothetical protein [Paenibacillus endophyticus]MBB3153233.1 phenylacetate-coenzyme A ligase PaaK-like adenylate-forming protein [Paenibacillus endophyticus]